MDKLKDIKIKNGEFLIKAAENKKTTDKEDRRKPCSHPRQRIAATRATKQRLRRASAE